MNSANNSLTVKKCGKYFSLVLLLILGSVGSQAQGRRALDDRFMKPNQSTSEPTPNSNVVPAPNEEYRIGAGDVIEVRVEDAPELAVPNARVSPKGNFLMPYLKYVQAQGKTPEELSLVIADQLRGRYLKNPQVTVLVKQVNSHTFFIQGSVKKPGLYQIEGRPSLMQLISVAGGLLENRGSTAYIIRELKTPLKMSEVGGAAASGTNSQTGSQNTESGEVIKWEMFSSNISSLYKGHFDQDLKLEPGDIINIPPTDVFYVSGEVNLPGEFPLKDGTTLRQAIAMAQGPTAKAKPKNAVIFREDDKGKRIEIPVDIDAINKGKKEDVKLMANDIVAIPNSPLKSALLPILNAAGTGIGITAGGNIIRR